VYENRIKHLEEMHRILDKKIDVMEKTGTFEDNQLHEMKKQRLLYRDELAKLRRLQHDIDQEVGHDD
jgi:uncharacterized protein YdcH (DUF465 family)